MLMCKIVIEIQINDEYINVTELFVYDKTK